MEDGATLVREMGCTEADFLRWLPGATRNATIETTVVGTETLHRISLNCGAVEIRTRPLPARRIAGIVLPVLRVEFRFSGLDAQQRASFLGWFDHYTRRGGG
jgi:hypothetical protein